MSKKLIVKGLSSKATEADLRPAFAAYGRVVEIQLVVDPGTRAVTGYVTFADAQAAVAAMNGLDGTRLGGDLVKIDPEPDIP